MRSPGLAARKSRATGSARSNRRGNRSACHPHSVAAAPAPLASAATAAAPAAAQEQARQEPGRRQLLQLEQGRLHCLWWQPGQRLWMNSGSSGRGLHVATEWKAWQSSRPDPEAHTGPPPLWPPLRQTASARAVRSRAGRGPPLRRMRAPKRRPRGRRRIARRPPALPPRLRSQQRGREWCLRQSWCSPGWQSPWWRLTERAAAPRSQVLRLCRWHSRRRH